MWGAILNSAVRPGRDCTPRSPPRGKNGMKNGSGCRPLFLTGGLELRVIPWIRAQ